MAITSISRMQHRRGIKTDLPDNLYEGELGWCLDTRELFIGNGQGFSGNSQVLTQWSANTDLINYTYVGPSGIPATTGTPATPISRSLGSKLDDFINVKDYGAAGDGITDDTLAIQRAISDRWATMSPLPEKRLMSVVNIMFPPGTYRITAPIKIYPMTNLIGAGGIKTVIMMDAGTAPCLIRTADSNGNTAANIGMDGGVLPTDIVLQGFTFDNTRNPDASGILLQRSSRVRMIDCRIMGGWQLGTSTTSGTRGISIETLGNLYLCDNISMQWVLIFNFVEGLYCSDPARFMVCDTIRFIENYRGAVFGENPVLGGPSYVRISNSTFRIIESRGLSVYSPNPGITSTNNSYVNAGDIGGVRPIYFSTISNACSSINDVFSRDDNTKIDIGNAQRNLFISSQQVSIPSNSPITIGPLTMVDNVVANQLGVSYDLSLYNTVFIQYSIVRGTTRRIGTLMLIADGGSVTTLDTGTDHNGNTGVVIDAVVADGMIELVYDTNSTGQSGLFSYIETKWFS